MYSTKPATMIPLGRVSKSSPKQPEGLAHLVLAKAPDMPYRVNALPSSWGSNTAAISRKEAGMRVAPAIPLIARKTKKEYWSGRKEMTRLRIPRAMKPYAKTGLAELCNGQ
jgi:hypothetical protein